jgi:TonB family protein
MYFDFEDYRPDISPVGRAISAREGLLISIIVHAAAVIGIIALPALMPARVAPVAEMTPADRPEDRPRFVFVQPRNDERALQPPDRADLSDQDRRARSRERARQPTNPLPFSRGNTPERVERAESRGDPRQQADSQQALAQPAPAAPPEAPKLPESQGRLQLPSNRQPQNAPRFSGSSLDDALRNLQRYIQADQFDNQRGGGMFGPAIQFDTKGVEFGPWVRRFVAQVKRNWEPLIPLAAMTMHGHVVITFNVHKSGAITDLAVVQPAPIEAFDTAAYGALVSSNPTAPLPPEYPADKAFFTVTFFYNEEPQ